MAKVVSLLPDFLDLSGGDSEPYPNPNTNGNNCSDEFAGVLWEENQLQYISTLEGRPRYQNETYYLYWENGVWYVDETNVGNVAGLAGTSQYPWLDGIGEKDCSIEPLQNAIIVSGAGTDTSNGTYTLWGLENGRNRYVYGSNFIQWDGSGAWYLFDDPEERNTYVSQSDVLLPWDGVWTVEDADEPPPTLTPTTI